ncbi:MAG: bifunctional hydroxymethylpyrimidine kinase/phosphomethylpyrimidine kinase [Pyrinomonadaceae bacterium]
MTEKKSQIANRKLQITPVCLTIAGHDPSGGAGIIADIKTFTSFGCFATAAVTSLTFQNTIGVFGAVHQTAESVRRQIEPVLNDFTVSALKTGMLPTREIIEETARIVRVNKLKNLVVDPVVRSTSGFDLIDDEALEALIKNLFPLADLVTPNIPEAERITKTAIKNSADIQTAAKIMQDFGARTVIIKGGHLPFSDGEFQVAELENQNPEERKSGSKKIARDILFTGREVFEFSAEFIETGATHGTGCTFASAIAASLARGKNLLEAVEKAKRFVTEAIRTAPAIGHGHSPVNHSIKDFD